MLLEPLPLETTRESPSFKLEPMETERSPGPRLQELLGPSPKRDPQAVKERGEEQLSGQVGGERGCGYPAVSTVELCCQGEGMSDLWVPRCGVRDLEVVWVPQRVGGGRGNPRVALFYGEQRRLELAVRAGRCRPAGRTAGVYLHPCHFGSHFSMPLLPSLFSVQSSEQRLGAGEWILGCYNPFARN